MPCPCRSSLFFFVFVFFFSSPVSAEASVLRSDDSAGRALRMSPPPLNLIGPWPCLTRGGSNTCTLAASVGL
ncbi:hypothetical protein J3E69DRAFT_325657 [Trichoderma sp. SZMC 28015]